MVGHGGFFSRIVGRHLPNCGFAWVSTPASLQIDIKPSTHTTCFFLLMVTPRCSHKEDLKGVGPVLYYSALRSLLFALALAFLRFAYRPVHKPTHPSNVTIVAFLHPKYSSFIFIRGFYPARLFHTQMTFSSQKEETTSLLDDVVELV